MSIKSNASAVLRLLVSSSKNPKRIDYADELQYQEGFADYEYCMSVFQYLQDNFPEFVIVFEGTKPFGHLAMHRGREDEIKTFLEEGGCEAFDNYASFIKHMKEQKLKTSKPQIAIDNRQYSNKNGNLVVESTDTSINEMDNKKGFSLNMITFIYVIAALATIYTGYRLWHDTGKSKPSQNQNSGNNSPKSSK